MAADTRYIGHVQSDIGRGLVTNPASRGTRADIDAEVQDIKDRWSRNAFSADQTRNDTLAIQAMAALGITDNPEARRRLGMPARDIDPGAEGAGGDTTSTGGGFGQPPIPGQDFSLGQEVPDFLGTLGAWYKR